MTRQLLRLLPGLFCVLAMGLPPALIAQEEAGSGPDLADALADLELVLDVERDLDAVDRGLRELWDATLAGPGQPRKADLVGLLNLGARLAVERGELAVALAIARGERVLPDPDLDIWDDWSEAVHQAAAGAELTDLAQALDARRERRGDAVGAELRATVEGALEGLIENPHSTGEASTTFASLGSRAVPVLLDIATEWHEGEGPDVFDKRDPLHWVGLVAPEEVGAWLEPRLDAISTRRLASRMDQLDIAERDEHYLFVADRPTRLDVSPAWRAATLELLSRRDGYAAPFRELVHRKAFDPQLARALLKALFDIEEPGEAKGTADALLGRWRPYREEILEGDAELRVVYEELLAHPLPEFQRTAAESLTCWADPSPLRALVGHPDGFVRQQVARSLLVREVYESRVTHDGNPHRESIRFTVTPTLGEAERALLARLCGDPDREVRRVAARALVETLGRGEPLDRDVYIALATDKDPEVRTLLTGLATDDHDLRNHVLALLADDPVLSVRLALAQALSDPEAFQLETVAFLLRDLDPVVRERAVGALVAGQGELPAEAVGRLVRSALADDDPLVRRALVRWDHGDDDLAREVLLGLARDADATVLEALDERLATEVRDAREESTASRLVPVLQERLFPRSPSRPPFLRERGQAFTGLIRWRSGQTAVATWAVTHDDEEAWEAVILALTRYESVAVEAFDSLDDEVLEQLIVGVARRGGAEALRGSVRPDVWQGRVALGRRLLADESHPPAARLRGALLVGAEATSEDRAAVLATLRSLEGLRAEVSEAAGVRRPIDVEFSGLRRLLSAFVHALPRDGQEALLVELLDDEQITDAMDDAVGLDLVPDGWSASAPVVERAAQRWIDGRDLDLIGSLVARVILALADHPRLLTEGRVRHGLDGRGSRATMLRVLLDLRDPGLRHHVVTFLTTTPVAPGERTRSLALDVLTATPDDAALAMLVDIRERAPSEEVRAASAAALQQVLREQAALAEVHRRSVLGEARQQATALFLSMLEEDDPDLRIEALEGLGEIGALEALPVILGHLDHADPAVRRAARRALVTVEEASARGAAAAARVAEAVGGGDPSPEYTAEEVEDG